MSERITHQTNGEAMIIFNTELVSGNDRAMSPTETLRHLRDAAEATKELLTKRRTLGMNDPDYQALDQLNDERWEAYERAAHTAGAVGQDALQRVEATN